MSEDKKETTNEVVLSDEQVAISKAVSAGSIGDLLKKSEKQGFSITSTYLEMESGETQRFAAMQMHEMTVEDKEAGEGITKTVPCLLMIDENNSTISAAQTVLVNSIKPHLPCLVEVTCKGSVDLGKGRSYTDFDVFILKPLTK